jgi:hypothetical protein
MLIKVKRKELYKKWLRYFEAHDPDLPPYAQRTFAFINSKKGLSPIGNY